jgi:hypothetical protein
VTVEKTVPTDLLVSMSTFMDAGENLKALGFDRRTLSCQSGHQIVSVTELAMLLVKVEAKEQRWLSR